MWSLITEVRYVVIKTADDRLSPAGICLKFSAANVKRCHTAQTAIYRRFLRWIYFRLFSHTRWAEATSYLHIWAKELPAFYF
jgi:hypothetical protein